MLGPRRRAAPLRERRGQERVALVAGEFERGLGQQVAELTNSGALNHRGHRGHRGRGERHLLGVTTTTPWTCCCCNNSTNLSLSFRSSSVSSVFSVVGSMVGSPPRPPAPRRFPTHGAVGHPPEAVAVNADGLPVAGVQAPEDDRQRRALQLVQPRRQQRRIGTADGRR